MINFRNLLLLLFFCAFGANYAFGYRATHFSDTTKAKRNLRITPLPVIYYSPETRLGFGALVATNFETDKIRGGVTRTSYSQTYALYTINRQYDFGNMVRVYSPLNKFIFFGKVNFTYFPEFYYGIETEQPQLKKDTIRYNRLGGDFRFYWAWKKNYYAGFATRFSKFSNISSGVGSFQDDQPLGYDGYWVQGFAPAITIETRDSFVYPRNGFYLEALYYVYPSWGGKSFGFQQMRLDIRKYFPLKLISEIDAIALQFVATVSTGDVPFKSMADIGGANTMRGYYTGFYRYKNLYAFQAEYRANIWKRLGATVWLGGALTPTKWYTFFDHALKPNAGVGLRIMMNKQDRLNVRVDQGFGKEGQKGFYLDISEAY
jgi:Outer membrane protein/protective antigen OMA87